MYAYHSSYMLSAFFLYLEPPNIIQATVLTPRSIQVTWESSLSSDVIGYLISYTTTASYVSGGSVMVNGVDNTTYNLTNLEEDISYTITVQATVDGIRAITNTDGVSVKTYTAGK